MSSNYTEPTDADERDDDSDDFKNLRAKARKADQYEREMNSMKRELAFIRAGVPMDDPKMSYFVKGYEGDLEPEQIRTAAIEAGFMQAPSQEPDVAAQQAQQGQSAVVQASTGTQPSNDLNGAMYQLEQAYNEGGTAGMLAVAQQYGIRIAEYED